MIEASHDWTIDIRNRLETISALETRVLEVVKTLSDIVNSLFLQTALTSEVIKKFPLPICVDRAKERVFVICKDPLPTIYRKGGWKDGYTSLMFDATSRKVALVWVLIDNCKREGRCLEQELSESYKDTQFWPRVHFVYRGVVPHTERIEARRYLFFDFYACDFEIARKKYALTESHLCIIIKQVAEAIHFIHKIGLIHGDIKTPNILIDKRAVLCDFDLSFYQKREKPIFRMYGTPSFSSPELVSPLRKGRLTDYKPSDMYALGISLQDPTFWHDKNLWPKMIEIYMSSSIKDAVLRQQAYDKQKIIYSESLNSLNLMRHEKPTIEKVNMVIKTALQHPDMYDRPSAEDIISYINKLEVTEPDHLFREISSKEKCPS